MSIRILSVRPGSVADRYGILPDEYLAQINAETIIDEIDYQALSMPRDIVLTIIGKDGTSRSVQILKDAWEPLGLSLDETVILKPRHCHNRCMFCFIDQLPAGLRKTLYVKDDDWRLSLIMGNYITLTNVDDKEFNRILRRKASPLYISVHATDENVRKRMMNNSSAGLLMERLSAFRDNGIKFHCQIVLCPGINDGAILDKTINDLASLYPSAQSVAIVPVGLTAHRNGLSELTPFTRHSAASLIQIALQYQKVFLHRLGTRFVYPSDEFYCLAGTDIPDNDYYEDYPQIENGVGMLRLLQHECEEYSSYIINHEKPEYIQRHLLIPTGVSAAPFIEQLAARYAPPGVTAEVIPVVNRFFGKSITVTGLLVGADLKYALSGKDCDEILISANMLREGKDIFLDNTTLTDLQEFLHKKITVVENTGESFINALYGTEDK